ncbi:2-oxo acid dehydrogenase subunit E2 [Rhizobium sp. B230/85]|uniref:2-oxo acid dehydrogenase subunit E2 n=1 Tax=unclassified Rhizobium TaxID=2613769 RepID=UPI001ADA0F1E|nr:MULTISPECIES: 2-oxo acid dehydrogenase subunit E2 [unclassified Rhizobium]MBO9136458.1 2-oxo acid dehydrogenase subunit E2 [Rhizobium sp. B209b/85]QXZ98658.1 2-oxo acid dehydrogenase subunit E2 [Rhizobium sp. B230/85]
MSNIIEVTLPDIGDYKDLPVVEIFAKPGDILKVDEPLITVESDKATMEVPSPSAGKVVELKISVGSKVSQGSLLLTMEAVASDAKPAVSAEPAPAAKVETQKPAEPPAAVAAAPAAQAAPAATVASSVSGAHATPSVRQLARELGVDLGLIKPTGPKGRILRDNLVAFVKGVVTSGPAPSAGGSSARSDLPPWPVVDFAKFGPIERQPLSRIQKISGGNLTRNYLTIPHVTNFDKADVTDIEAFRVAVNREPRSQEIKLTMVAFLIKASALALKAFPRFNSSLEGDELVLKNYVHVGFAADTPKGLMVPVIRDCDRKGLIEIAGEMKTLAEKARAGTLSGNEMQGGCFSVSSLGGVGGSGFTPIINAPEVAILGAGRSNTEAVWDGKLFVPRQILPMSLSWDHRVVDGVAAAKFLGHIASTLGDLRRAML